MGKVTEAILALFGENKTQSTVTVKPGEKSGSNEPHLNQQDDSDCLGCKVVSTGTLLAATAYVAYYTLKNRSKYTGRYRVAFLGQNLSLVTLLALLSVSRAFDKGLFDKNRKNESLAEACENDFKYIVTRIGLKTPDFEKDEKSSK